MTYVTVLPDEHSGTRPGEGLSLAVIARGLLDEIIVWGYDVRAFFGGSLLPDQSHNLFQHRFLVPSQRQETTLIRAA